MAIETIESLDDPRLADYRSVSDPQLARSRGLFVAEGRSVVARLIGDGRYDMHSVLLSEQVRRELEPSLAQLEPRVPVYVCRTADFLGVTGYNFHRGCVALAKRPPATSLDAALGATRLVVVLEAVGNADNVGGVFRNAAAFGAGAVLLSPTCCDPLYRKAIRTSMAATLTVPFVCLEHWPDALTAVRQAGFSLVALSPRAPADTLDAFVARERPPRVALLVGSEGAGLTIAAERAADHRLRIPMRPGIDSLNLAVATGIALSRLGTDARE